MNYIILELLSSTFDNSSVIINSSAANETSITIIKQKQLKPSFLPAHFRGMHASTLKFNGDTRINLQVAH
jgi:hypothetical protein